MTDPMSSVPKFGQNSGLVIFSKYKLSKINHQEFNHRRLLSAKGWLECELDFSEKDQNFWIVNTHFEHKDAQLKISQIHQVCLSPG